MGGILSVLLAALLSSLLVSRNSYLSTDASVQVQEEARRAFRVMTQELRAAGNVNNDASTDPAGVQRLDFQLARRYDAAAAAVVWGSETTDGAWVHYVSDAPNRRLMRCVTANQLDAMPAGFAGCRVLANAVSAPLADTAFTYDHARLEVTIRLQTALASSQLPGGTLQVSPTPLTTRVRLRNL
jgi:hypothetical protein